MPATLHDIYAQCQRTHACHIWHGQLVMYLSGVRYSVRPYVWELAYGTPVPHHIYATCGNCQCVAAEHLTKDRVTSRPDVVACVSNLLKQDYPIKTIPRNLYAETGIKLSLRAIHRLRKKHKL